MSGDSSEEKSLPPTPYKLRKAREKGQVVTSREALASVSTLVVLFWLMARRESIWRDLRSLYDTQRPDGMEFLPFLAAQAKTALDVTVGIVAPIIVLVVSVVILLGMVVSGGPVFSTKPLTPDFNKLNPAKGFKKIFGRAAMLKFLMNVLRVAAVGALLSVMLASQIGALLPTPPCGMTCAERVVTAILWPLLIGLAAVLTVAALFDYLVSRYEFLREQRMTITEFKREFKDQDGDPLLKGHLSMTRREMVERPTGLSQATVLIRDGAKRAVAVRYVEGDTPAPIVVMRLRGAEAIGRAIRARPELAQAEDAEVVELIARVAVGDYITEDAQVMAVARHLS